ncbi:MAG: tRNA uridine(34) 5-carboxymethylaminomethyl modification radical SAM/GNAT enzyme Elp3 [Thermoplasmata archaeon HGW-Thermoplasmata-1]|nr:MAG: tRNA uridine(34) 5-carboxymethylaminomethyl modification radical SAM/GNAT enzyme Elp3 [Thermoplasmata archaeon HGW-Thermoplasmata-1]
MGFAEDILELIRSGAVADKATLHRAKVKLCRKYRLSEIPSDADLLASLPPCIEGREAGEIRKLLQKKPARTISGVAVVAVMTSPEACPHGKCIVCPGGPDTGSAQSYTGSEPAAMRASAHCFDPFEQTKSRLEQLSAIGHITDKVDLILMGGTFTARDFYYQEWFVKRCFDAMNGFASASLEDAKKGNESAKNRCIGLTVETRPDWMRLQHCDRVLGYGATRVELGVQSTSDAVLQAMERGHTTNDTACATRILKDSGLKVCYHMMPGLPGSDRDTDIESFRDIFSDGRFMPDMIKIYPTLVVGNTKLAEMWRRGEYVPLETQAAAELVARIKSFIPEWVRVQRVERDIPVPLISAGVDKSNLRQIAEQLMAGHGTKCRCIRCREVGHRLMRDGSQPDLDSVRLVRREYDASGGRELFLSLEDVKQDILIGYARLRMPGAPHRPEITERSALIRELKIHGPALALGEKPRYEWQHRGFGQEIMAEAIRLSAEEFDAKKMLVTSGVGVKSYYRKMGFSDDGPYVSKTLTK